MQLQNRIRQASGLDLRLLSYDYELEVQNIEEQADGCVQIEAVEYADMRFSHTPDTNSQVTGVWHSFVIKETDGQWRLTHHAAYDSAYFSFIRWENSATGRSTGGTSSGEFVAMAEERIQNAREQIESREAAADGRTGAAAAAHAYDRETAAAYAREWAGERNPQQGSCVDRSGFLPGLCHEQQRLRTLRADRRSLEFGGHRRCDSDVHGRELSSCGHHYPGGAG